MPEISDQRAIIVELPGARAAFSTRHGGLSSGPYESLNLGILTDDDRDAVIGNRRLLEQDFGVGFAYGMQVHGNGVRTVTAPTDPQLPLEDSDALVTSVRGVAPMVLSADCVPVAIAGGGGAAIVHAGWRGLDGGVIRTAVDQLRGLVGADVTLAAVIGPGAGPCCYEVSDELHERFAAVGQDHRSGQNLDLKAIASEQLECLGIERIADLGLCTICDPAGRFFSHRRDRGVTGRQAGFVWLT